MPTDRDDGKARLGSLSKNRYRNLVQYRNMTDPQFDEFWDKMSQGIEASANYEKRIAHKLDDFARDYDIDGLKINDMLTLRALAQAYITLEDYEAYSFSVREKGISLEYMIEIEKMNSIMSSLRKDISNMQTDLNITRKVRKSDKEASVIGELERLKQAAKVFYKEKMFYVWCPKCKMLLFTGWFHYPENKTNKLQLSCDRILDNGDKCGEKLQISSKDLLENRGVNIDDIPETLK